MEQHTRERVDGWWAALLGVEPDRLWREVTVAHPHARLGDYAGWYVAWRGEGAIAGVHVSAPTTAEADEVASLRGETPLALQEPDFWAAFGAQRGLELRGPAVHAYLDVDPGPADGVVEVSPADLETMRAEVTAQEWDDWTTEEPVHPVAVVEDGRLVAAASLGPWDGKVLDVGVLTVPDRRGRGLATRVGRTCASYAVREHGVALWRAALTNIASVRAAVRIGFEPCMTQLALRPPVSGS